MQSNAIIIAAIMQQCTIYKFIVHYVSYVSYVFDIAEWRGSLFANFKRPASPRRRAWTRENYRPGVFPSRHFKKGSLCHSCIKSGQPLPVCNPYRDALSS